MRTKEWSRFWRKSSGAPRIQIIRNANLLCVLTYLVLISLTAHFSCRLYSQCSDATSQKTGRVSDRFRALNPLASSMLTGQQTGHLTSQWQIQTDRVSSQNTGQVSDRLQTLNLLSSRLLTSQQTGHLTGQKPATKKKNTEVFYAGALKPPA